MFVGDSERRFGIGNGEHLHAGQRGSEPFLECPADGFLVVHDKYGVGHGTFMIDAGGIRTRQKPKVALKPVRKAIAVGWIEPNARSVPLPQSLSCSFAKRVA